MGLRLVDRRLASVRLSKSPGDVSSGLFLSFFSEPISRPSQVKIEIKVTIWNVNYFVQPYLKVFHKHSPLILSPRLAARTKTTGLFKEEKIAGLPGR